MTSSVDSQSYPARQWLLVGALFTLLVAAWFSPWWLCGRYFAPLDILNQMLPPWNEGVTYPKVHNHFVSDAVTQYIPYHILADRSLKQDGYIGWNPYAETGTKLSANTMALPGDWSLQLYRCFDFWTAWHLGLIGQVLLAGLGMLVFLGGRGCAPWASLAAATAFAANGQFVAWFYHRWALACFCWIPWLLWALFALIREVRRPEGSLGFSAGWFLLSSGFLAMAFLGGTLQHAVYVVLVVACFWVGEVLFRAEKFRAKMRCTALLAAVGLVGLLLASVTLIPCTEAFIASRIAGDTRGAIGYPHGLLQPLFNLIAYLFTIYPSIMGSPQTMDAWKLFKSDLFEMGYIGAIPGILAFLALFTNRAPITARLLIGVALLIPLTPLVGPLYHRVLLLFAFGGSWVFADYLSRSSSEDRSLFARRALRWIGFISVAWVASSIALIFLAPKLKRLIGAYVSARLSESQFGIYRDWVLDRAHSYIDSLYIWSPEQWPLILLITASFLVIHVGAKRRIASSLWQGALAILLILELTLLASRWITTVNPRDNPPYRETREITEIKKLVGSGRLLQNGGLISKTPLTPNIPGVFGMKHLVTYESIRPVGLWTAAGNSSDVDLLSRLGAVHLLLGRDESIPAGWRKIWEGGGMIICSTITASSAPSIVSVRKNEGSVQEWIPVTPVAETMNSLSLPIPQGADQLRIYITDDKKWAAFQNGARFPMVRGDGILVNPSGTATQILFKYQPIWYEYAPSIPAFLSVTIGIIFIYGLSGRLGKQRKS